MDNTQTMRKGLAELEKHISLRQIAIRSNINYITLRKIKSGETKNVSSGVIARFDSFKKEFDPSADVTPVRPGPKPKAAPAAPAAPAAQVAKKKPGPKPKAAAPAKKKMGRPKKEAAAPADAPVKKKMGRPKKVVAAAPAEKPAAPARKVAAKKIAAKPGRKPGRKPAISGVTPSAATNFATPMLGDALRREIEIAEARIEYLKSLQMVEQEFLKAIGKK